MTIKKNLWHIKKQFLSENFILRSSLQQIFRSKLETEYFHYKQKAKDAEAWGLHS